LITTLKRLLGREGGRLLVDLRHALREKTQDEKEMRSTRQTSEGKLCKVVAREELANAAGGGSNDTSLETGKGGGGIVIDGRIGHPAILKVHKRGRVRREKTQQEPTCANGLKK